MATIDPVMDNTFEDAEKRAPLVLGGLDYTGVTETVTSVWEASKPPKIWYVLLAVSMVLLAILGACVGPVSYTHLTLPTIYSV